MVSLHRLMQSCSSWLGLLSSNPNMSRIPMNPSVALLACLMAWLRMARLLLDFLLPAVPTVLAWRLATSWWTDSLEDMDPDKAGLLRLLALFYVLLFEDHIL